MEIYATNSEHAKILTARAKFVEKYCNERGWNQNELSLEQVLEIRQQSEWENAK